MAEVQPHQQDRVFTIPNMISFARLVGGGRPRRARAEARGRAARPAAARLWAAACQLRWQGGNAVSSIRISATFRWLTPNLVCGRGSRVRLGIRYMGNCTVLVGCSPLRQAGSRATGPG